MQRVPVYPSPASPNGNILDNEKIDIGQFLLQILFRFHQFLLISWMCMYLVLQGTITCIKVSS